MSRFYYLRNIPLHIFHILMVNFLCKLHINFLHYCSCKVHNLLNSNHNIHLWDTMTILTIPLLLSILYQVCNIIWFHLRIYIPPMHPTTEQHLSHNQFIWIRVIIWIYYKFWYVINNYSLPLSFTHFWLSPYLLYPEPHFTQSVSSPPLQVRQEKSQFPHLYSTYSMNW